jgi:hypothetical protein
MPHIFTSESVRQSMHAFLHAELFNVLYNWWLTALYFCFLTRYLAKAGDLHGEREQLETLEADRVTRVLYVENDFEVSAPEWIG